MNTTIIDVEAIPLERQLDRVFTGGTYRITSRYTLVTEVRLADGTVGQTYGGDEERYQKYVVAVVNGRFRELLVGQDACDVERLWATMFDCDLPQLPNRGIHALDLLNRAIQMQAIAAVDIALWDAVGKSLGLPVSKLLGSCSDRVPVIAIGGYHEHGKGDKEFIEDLQHYKRWTGRRENESRTALSQGRCGASATRERDAGNGCDSRLRCQSSLDGVTGGKFLQARHAL
jgi:D-galactarolactone cycloisomerase